MNQRSLGAILALSVVLLGGCSAVTSVTNPGTIDEDYHERTIGMEVEDGNIENKAKHNMGRVDARLNDSRINVDSYNGVVLLTGQVPSEELRTSAEDITSQVRNVRRVHNELTISGNLPGSRVMQDAWLTTKVNTVLATSNEINSSHIKVVTENATVYLMGMVSHAEGEQAVQIAASAGGMERIVKVFDYID
ncbi:BON domain-containing protein [Halomonas huangheensis]|uniref:BON domain-containing protein n=1 Tax=Halomonas huangheensis TaxID=1178482 RepID=W1N6A4_9GAMM|nr:BON domain-containing protein [Halomonas huangheensis]ALM52133.1 transporter [Halomonas huangheensis]ERL50696.1 hypothetical protein BJB45_06070 [Halomonas huangheensis]